MVDTGGEACHREEKRGCYVTVAQDHDCLQIYVPAKSLGEY